jgi:predicted unusual protein kinase regulating ubiquinone biosynthesis (AarF/ABC1/UbiB family)
MPSADESDELENLTGGLRRMWSTASLTSKLGMKAASRVLWKRNKKDDDGEVDLEAAAKSDDAAIAAAKKLVAKMGNLKGLVMKAGQIASYMPGSLPPAAQEVLAELRYCTFTAPAPAQARAVDLPDRGRGERPLLEVLERIGPGAAQLGAQHAFDAGERHRRRVSLGIEDAIRSDLKMVGVIARLSSIGSPLDGGAIAGELRDRLLEECDYEREAASQILFARILADIPGASAPEVVTGRSRRRVLTTVFADGVPIAESPTEVRDRAGKTIFRACFELLFRRCIYNADPHPGNYLIAPDGGVTFLDFGCVRRFDPDMILTWRTMARAILDGDREGFKAGFRALGFVGKAKGFDWDYQWDAMRYLYRPYLEPGFHYNNAFVAKSFGILMFDNPNRMKLSMPPEWLFLNRLQWGVNAVLAQLGTSTPATRDEMEALLTCPLEPA